MYLLFNSTRVRTTLCFCTRSSLASLLSLPMSLHPCIRTVWDWRESGRLFTHACKMRIEARLIFGLPRRPWFHHILEPQTLTGLLCRRDQAYAATWTCFVVRKSTKDSPDVPILGSSCLSVPFPQSRFTLPSDASASSLLR